VAELVGVLKALSAGPRLKIVRLLKARTLCVNAITARLGMTQSAVSQHLRVLREAGLVRAEKRGYWMHYSVDRKALGKWRAAIDMLLAVEG
jgi:DNA-binding transcriptional ArsR family regulator